MKLIVDEMLEKKRIKKMADYGRLRKSKFSFS